MCWVHHEFLKFLSLIFVPRGREFESRLSLRKPKARKPVEFFYNRTWTVDVETLSRSILNQNTYSGRSCLIESSFNWWTFWWDCYLNCSFAWNCINWRMLESFPSKGFVGGRREDVFSQLRTRTKCPSRMDVRSITDAQTGIKMQIVTECQSHIIHVHQRVRAGCTFLQALLASPFQRTSLEHFQ